MTAETLVALTSNEWIAIIVVVLIFILAGTLLGRAAVLSRCCSFPSLLLPAPSLPTSE